MENTSSVDSDQLASLDSSESGSTLFQNKFMSGFIPFSKKFIFDTAQKGLN